MLPTHPLLCTARLFGVAPFCFTKCKAGLRFSCSRRWCFYSIILNVFFLVLMIKSAICAIDFTGDAVGTVTGVVRMGSTYIIHTLTLCNKQSLRKVLNMLYCKDIADDPFIIIAFLVQILVYLGIGLVCGLTYNWFLTRQESLAQYTIGYMASMWLGVSLNMFFIQLVLILCHHLSCVKNEVENYRFGSNFDTTQSILSVLLLKEVHHRFLLLDGIRKTLERVFGVQILLFILDNFLQTSSGLFHLFFLEDTTLLVLALLNCVARISVVSLIFTSCGKCSFKVSAILVSLCYYCEVSCEMI